MSVQYLQGTWYITTACREPHPDAPCETCWRMTNHPPAPSDATADGRAG